jgi:hypothetical protein
MLAEACAGRAPMQEDQTMPPIKKIVMWLVVVFLLYAIVTSPTDAASIFESAWDVVTNGVSNVAAFFDSLIRGD